MIVRDAQNSDLDAVLAAMRKLHKEIGFERFEPFQPLVIGGALKAFLDNPDVIFVVARRDNRLVGTAAFSLLTQWHAPHVGMAAEIFWWVDIEHRRGDVAKLMVRHAETVAKAKGIQSMTIGAPPGVERILEKLGYSLYRTVGIKEL